MSQYVDNALYCLLFPKLLLPVSQGSNTKGGLVESYYAQDGSNWYRKYEDGWIEQGGRTGSGFQNIYFPISFTNNQYYASCISVGGYHWEANREHMIINCYTNYMYVYINELLPKGTWYACGY